MNGVECQQLKSSNNCNSVEGFCLPKDIAIFVTEKSWEIVWGIKKKCWPKRWALRHTTLSVKQKESVIYLKWNCYVWQLKWEQVWGSHSDTKQKEALSCPWGKWSWLMSWITQTSRGSCSMGVSGRQFHGMMQQCWDITCLQTGHPSLFPSP